PTPYGHLLSFQPPWIEQKITQLDCAKFVPSTKEPFRCGCGRLPVEHAADVQLEAQIYLAASQATGGPRNSHGEPERWQVRTHTREMPITAYGTVEFQGGPHATKARYVRLNYETSPEVVVHLLLHEWRLRVPSLVISVLGGLANSPLQARLARVVQRGLLRAAKTTGAWVITNGLDTGVTRHVGEALGEEVHIRGSNIVALGIAPWGVVQQRELLVGLNHTCLYHAQGTIAGRQETALNSHHNYFLLADNGTSGKFSTGEICLRRRLEQYLAQQPIGLRRLGDRMRSLALDWIYKARLKTRIRPRCLATLIIITPGGLYLVDILSLNRGSGHKSRVPVVGVLIEGGHQTFRTVFELVTGRNPVPVVICDGSGRAADFLAFMHRYVGPDGDLPGPLRQQIIANLARTFQIKQTAAEGLYLDMKLCMKRRDLVSLSPGQKLSLADQLSLTMAWQRSDIARSRVLVNVNDWSVATLENAMTDALINDRLEFVQLLLEKGLDIYRFLTVKRLEDLYTVSFGSSTQAFHRLFVKVLGARSRVCLRAVGQLLQELIGCGYQHPYCSKQPDPHLLLGPSTLGTTSSSKAFLNPLTAMNGKPGGGHIADALIPQTLTASTDVLLDRRTCFRYPYTELLQWALLTCRFSLARYIVLAGEESIAKALLSVRILRAIRKVVDVDSETEFIETLRNQEE
ncbi:unnamed protein product, partial [Schistocephalus solidus]|uniref:LSDAT_euk domain-containing protein n=1 Tax=Schistocephalus solidus TaxID=70667 RepID=A0A183SNM8_SCHSO